MLNMHLHESHLQTYDFLLINSSTAVRILVTRFILRIDYTTRRRPKSITSVVKTPTYTTVLIDN